MQVPPLQVRQNTPSKQKVEHPRQIILSKVFAIFYIGDIGLQLVGYLSLDLNIGIISAFVRKVDQEKLLITKLKIGFEGLFICIAIALLYHQLHSFYYSFCL